MEEYLISLIMQISDLFLTHEVCLTRTDKSFKNIAIEIHLISARYFGGYQIVNY